MGVRYLRSDTFARWRLVTRLAIVLLDSGDILGEQVFRRCSTGAVFQPSTFREPAHADSKHIRDLEVVPLHTT